MVREGVLEASGKKVDAAFGLHVMSAMEETGVFTAKSGPIMSASDGLFVTVHGAGGHGSAPFAAKDPVTAAAEMVTALQTMVTRQFNIFDPVVISVGVLRAGTVRNIIPDTAYFEATIRSFSNEAHEKLQASVPQLLQGIARAHGLEVTVNYQTEYPTTINNESETLFARNAVEELFDATGYKAMRDPLAGSEDFSRVLNEVPGSFLFLSALTPGADAGHGRVQPLALCQVRRLGALQRRRALHAPGRQPATSTSCIRGTLARSLPLLPGQHRRIPTP